MTECKTITFRPTPEAEQQIEALMKRWDCKRTQAILRAVALASQSDIPAALSKPSEVTAPLPTRLLSDRDWRLQQGFEPINKIEVEANEKRLRNFLRKQGGVLPSQSTRPDPEKIAAFQRKAGMTAFDKRRK